MAHYVVKLADTAAEREQVHRLNHATFVEEIPQHPAAPDGRLVDRFDAENAYVVAVDEGGTVIGMLALRARRPFSLDQKLERLDDHLPPHRSACEVRLLSVRPDWRHRRVFRDLLDFAARHCIAEGHDLALISGTTRQLPLYANIGFQPFGALVGAEGARYQPMYLTLESFSARFGEEGGGGEVASFLTGPVALAPGVAGAAASAPVSHRDPAFVARLRALRERLKTFAHAADVAVMPGSGTLANDAVAASLAARGEPGLVLANGEFGARLVDHARRAGVAFAVLERAWGESFDEASLRHAMRESRARWIWAVHCETSTGVLNDLAMLKAVAADGDARLCIDATSTLGVAPVDLAGVHLATASSGKGLCALPGLALVFRDAGALPPTPRAPRYLDLSRWFDGDGVPFTHASNLCAALDAALPSATAPGRLARIARDATWLRRELRGRRFTLVAPEPVAATGVLTIALPDGVQSCAVADAMLARGFELGARSRYLVERNWLQVALMGACDAGALRRLPAALEEAAIAPARARAA